MEIHDILSIVSGLLFAYAFYPYFGAIKRLEIVPSLFTWMLWAALDLVTLVSMSGQGGVHFWLVLAALVGASISTLYSLKYGDRKVTKVNILCTLAVLLAIGFQLGNLGFLSLSMGCLGLLIAGIPLALKAWKDPSTEDRGSWTIFVISNIFGLLAVKDWQAWGDSLPALTFAVLDLGILGVVLFRPKRAT